MRKKWKLFHTSAYFTFSLYALMVFRPLADLAERYNVLQGAMASAERIFSMLDRKLEAEDPTQGVELGPIENIIFDDVWFAYEPDNWVLKGVSFTLSSGQSIALVGMTGSGKTTILNLLLRFYDIQKGTIQINNRDIRDYSLHSLRRQFSVVLQDPVIFSGTLADNITAYQPDVVSTYADISHAQEKLGYSPKTSLKEGITKFVEWYEKYNKSNELQA